MTPTKRTAALVAALGAAVLLLPSALVVVCGVVLAGAIFFDTRTTRDEPGIRRVVKRVVSRGVETGVRVVASDERVLLRQPGAVGIEVSGDRGVGQLDARLVALRRGRHTLAGVASAVPGRLGLVQQHFAGGAGTELLAYPDLVTARRLVLRLRRGRAAQGGRRTRGPLGLGTEFESVREYDPNDDFRQINWRASARLGRAMSNQYRVEQDRDVVCLLDCGRLMAGSLGRRTRLDAALDATVAVALAADELGDRCGAVAFDSELRCHVRPTRRGGRDVIDAVFDLEASSQDTDFELGLRQAGRMRRALIIVFTDLVDEAAARSLLRAVPVTARRHAVIVVSAREDELLELAGRLPERDEDAYATIAAIEVLDAARATAAALRRSGASVIEAAADTLAARCVDAYLSAKARARI